jgi:hypothetical protein
MQTAVKNLSLFLMYLKRTYDFESGSEYKTNFRPDPDPKSELKLLLRIRNTGFWNFLRSTEHQDFINVDRAAYLSCNNA